MRIRSVVVLSLLFAGACQANETVLHELRIGDQAARVELARTPDERSRGLMYRESLAPDCGMLFAFETAGCWSFWMRNTRIPLAIAFIAEDGRILNIEEMKPFDETPVGPAGAARYALEMGSGWFARHGIVAGTRVRFPDDLRRRLEKS